MNRKKVANIVLGISATILVISSIWFFILLGIANPDVYQKLNMFGHPQNKTKEVIVNYDFAIKSPTVVIQENTDETMNSTINAGSILLTIISSGITVVMSKFADRFWPSKKDK